MKKLGRTSSTFTTVVAGAAVLAVFGTGTAVAGGLITSAKIKNNTIKSIDVRNNNLKSVDILDNSLTGTDILDGSLTGGDIADFSLSNQDVGVLFATVNTDGTLANSSGGVTSLNVSAGQYEVDFGRDVAQCAFTATLANPGGGVPAPGYIVAADRGLNVEAVFVETSNDASAATNRSFHLLVVC
jgi:hypothetical protein